MPRQKKVAALKAISGTDQPCRADVDPVPLPKCDEIPEAPDWLSTIDAVEEFNKLAGIMEPLGLLNQANVGALAVMCELFGQIVDTAKRRNPLTASLLGQYRTLINDFGLTPVAQTRVGALDQGKKENKFAANKRQA